jgi:hypothetical protein
MTAYVLLLILGIIGYRASGKGRGPFSSLRVSRPRTRAEASGNAGESVVDTELRRVLTWLCGENFYLHPGPIVLNHAPGTAFPTTEVDHLAITPFGLFVFETKNWTGRIERGLDDDSLFRITPGGAREIRRSPVKQNRAKVAFLRDVMPAVWPVEGLGVFASDHCLLSAGLPLALITRSDIAYALRTRKANFDEQGNRPVNVRAAWQAILAIADVDADAIELHRARVRSKVASQ